MPRVTDFVNKKSEITEQFEQYRVHLQSVAFRILGSASDADDAVQETWLRLKRAEEQEIGNAEAWLTTVISRICIDMLRSRERWTENTEIAEVADSLPAARTPPPGQQMEMAEDAGLAMMVVLARLGSAERVAFVLHDLFAVPFDKIAEILDRSNAAAKKLASRARQRIYGAPTSTPTTFTEHRAVVEAFLDAARSGDPDALLAVLAPDVIRHADRIALRDDSDTTISGAQQVMEETLTNVDRAQFARPVLVDGAVGVAVAPGGKLIVVLRLTIADQRITEIDVIAEPDRLEQLILHMMPRS